MAGLDASFSPILHRLKPMPATEHKQQSWIGLEEFRTKLTAILDPYVYGIIGHRLQAEIEHDVARFFHENDARRVYVIPFGVPANVRISGAYVELCFNPVQERSTVQVRMTTAALVGAIRSDRKHTYLGSFNEWGLWYDRRDPSYSLEPPRLTAVRGSEGVTYYPHYQGMAGNDALREAHVRACAFNLPFSNPE